RLYLLICPEELAPDHLQASSRRLFTDRLVCAVDRNHPEVGEQLTEEQFCMLPLVPYAANPLPTFHELRFRQLALARPVEIRTQSFVSQPLMLPGSRLMALVHE